MDLVRYIIIIQGSIIVFRERGRGAELSCLSFFQYSVSHPSPVSRRSRLEMSLVVHIFMLPFVFILFLLGVAKGCDDGACLYIYIGRVRWFGLP